MPSDEARARRPLLQTVGAGAQAPEQVQVDNRTSEAGPTPPNLLRLDTYSEMRIFFYHRPVNALLVFVPIGIVAGALRLPAEAVFWLNFVAVIPLAPMITMAVWKISSDIGQLQGGLLKAVFGNIATLMICILALIDDQIQLIKWIIVGSTLSYSLLVLGCSFLVASYDRDRVEFSRTQVSILSSLVMVGSISLVIPTAMAASTPPEHDDTADSLILSHATAVVLSILFVSYLVFRFRTHQALFSHGPYDRGNQRIGDRMGLLSRPWVVRLIPIAVSLCLTVNGHYIIKSIDVSTERMRIPTSFVGMVLLPLTGNIVNAAGIVNTCRARKMDFAIRAVMNNVLDTLLFITPFLVLLGWIVNKPMELDFGLFEAIVFLLAMIIMTYLLQQGKTTYFEGVMLIGTYGVAAAAIYLRPDVQGTGASLALERRRPYWGTNLSQLAAER